MDPLEAAIYDFCFGDGRAVPPSVFLGRVVQPDEPLWTDEDRVKALEWLTRQKLQCPGCGRPKDESFDPEMEDQYDVTELQCHACAQQQQVAFNRTGRTYGRYFVTRPAGGPYANVDGAESAS